MSQFPHDDFAKNFLDSLLSPYGSVQSSYKISSEVRYVDIYFQPQIDPCPLESLGLLAQFVRDSLVIEPFRNSVTVMQINSCMSKLFDLHLTVVKEAKKQQQPEPGSGKLPKLWILTPTLSDRLLESVGAKLDVERGGEGIYVLPSGLKTGIVVIHQLPQTPETLWFRLLGKGRVQERAIAEVAALPTGHPLRDNVLELLGNLRVTLEAKINAEPEERELIMQLSPLYLEKIQAAERVGEARGEARMLVRLLNRRFGDTSDRFVDRIQQLDIARLEELGEALLDFTSLADLEIWFSQN
jgi:Domain of unknown function (DUF4351)